MNIVDNPNSDSLKPFGRYLDLCKESGTDVAGRSDNVEVVPVVSCRWMAHDTFYDASHVAVSSFIIQSPCHLTLDLMVTATVCT